MEVMLLIIFMAMVAPNHATDYDIMKFGAKADGKSDDSVAISNAWQEACKSTSPSKVIIPKGNYMVGPTKIQGPCQAPVTIQATGAQLVAPEDPQLFKSQNSWFQFQTINALTMIGGSFDGKGELAWKQNDCAKTGKCGSIPINLSLNKLTNTLLQDVQSIDSKQFHMNILGCLNLTLVGTKISAPDHSLNTDGIHIGRSSGVNISMADIKTGDDCVSIGDGSQQVNIEKVTCGPPGHGISIGSLGRYQNEEPVVGITVRNCTITSTMNGVRVKTWPGNPKPGVARTLHFEDININNVSTPILIDQEYCPYNHCTSKNPSTVKLSDISFKNIRGTSASQLAVQLKCSKGIPCENVELSDINFTYQGVNGSEALSECKNVQPKLSGQLFFQSCGEPAA
ncbi:exopolygalacturonase-like [Andrographis paniculata]|uniref:exopolygalacturonase-like n=1 Tax=Andrographis paniculata TaxID=175694 RepID=UPI0021E81B7C|nr:exopolygalacturonase-like [Andrographis paniculata]